MLVSEDAHSGEMVRVMGVFRSVISTCRQLQAIKAARLLIHFDLSAFHCPTII